jgi:cobalt-zinc-cadmium efflux system protein
VLAAQANAAGLLVVTAVISIEAVRRLLHPRPVDGGLVLLVALAAVIFNGLSAVLLVERDGHDLNMRAALLHMVADAGSSGGVAVSGGLILLTGMSWLDPVASLIVAAVIAVQAALLVHQANLVLLEATPAGLDLDRLLGAMAGVDGVEQVHDVHAWSLSSEVSALSAHIVLAGHPTLEQAQAVGERVKSAVTAFGIAHATLELECEACVTGEDTPCSIESIGLTGGAPAPRLHSHHH